MEFFSVNDNVFRWKKKKFNRLYIASVVRTNRNTDTATDTSDHVIGMRNSSEPIKSNTIQFINIDAFGGTSSDVNYFDQHLEKLFRAKCGQIVSSSER